MKVRAQTGEVPLLTVVEAEYVGRIGKRKRWVTIDQRGRQSATTYERLDVAIKHAAYQTIAWQFWGEEDNTFCR